MNRFDIAPFALPDAPPGEYWFEESREFEAVVARFRARAPERLEVEYWQHNWPRLRPLEGDAELQDPAGFGWSGTDDWFNGRWQRAKVHQEVRGRKATLRFAGLRSERLEKTPAGYDVDFRRTMGIKLAAPAGALPDQVEIYTRSQPTQTVLRAELDAGKRTRGKRLVVSGYNAQVVSLQPVEGVIAAPGQGLELQPGRRRSFLISVAHLLPAHRYSGDDGLVEFQLDHDLFTISLEALKEQGPVWYAEEGIFVTQAEDPTSFVQYRKQHAKASTINQQVAQREEQSLARAYFGQPRPHAVAYSFGCKHSPQRFWLEPNGDLLLHKDNLTRLDRPGQSAGRFLNKGNARFLFGLEKWIAAGRWPDPAPTPIANLRFRRGELSIEQQALCVPLHKSILKGELGFDEPTVALVRFRFHNSGDEPQAVRLPILYSEDSRRHRHVLHHDPGQSEYLVPQNPLTALRIDAGQLISQYDSEEVLRAVCETDMEATAEGQGVTLVCRLAPGESCTALLKIPYIALDKAEELAALTALEFDRSHRETSQFWRAEHQLGTQLCSPIPQLDSLHAAHLTHVEISDFSMPDAPDLINTSVGTSTYGNFSNESCMIVQELEQRGFHQDGRRRLDLWVKYQGTVPQPGNFTDYQGMFFGAGGFEQGHYNQHHGWILWALSEHFMITRDKDWFGRNAEAVIAGADWIFRQRRQTIEAQPRSRGWERGFLPAGSLEDVTEFYYWLSTNCLTWRGADAAARALALLGHGEAARVQREADAFGDDLRQGFETMRQHTPLVRLRDGRWVPHYPSRLYCRGRDQGWIRQVLEGAVYLLISGLYEPDSKQAGWILDDYQDNLYPVPPYGYVLRDPAVNLFNRSGFSIQPCLLAGLLPHLERDEPEIYLWMFFNAFAAIYREEIDGMIEHPLPELGFSNSVTFKTSDEANAAMWLRYLYVYWNRRELHFGRVLPRAWFAQQEPFALTGLYTHFGPVGIRYEPDLGQRRIVARVDLGELRDQPRIRVRFRHPEKAPLAAVQVDGKVWKDVAGEDVELTGRRGKVVVEARF